MSIHVSFKINYSFSIFKFELFLMFQLDRDFLFLVNLFVDGCVASDVADAFKSRYNSLKSKTMKQGCGYYTTKLCMSWIFSTGKCWDFLEITLPTTLLNWHSPFSTDKYDDVKRSKCCQPADSMSWGWGGGRLTWFCPQKNQIFWPGKTFCTQMGEKTWLS